MVIALGYKYNFVTAKHSQLKGWFNKKFIYEEKVFDKRLAKIYQEAFEVRQESDYQIVDFNLENDEIKKLLSDAEEFTSIIKTHLDVS
jgi:uncharacterized protein (UPF0332 family)